MVVLDKELAQSWVSWMTWTIFQITYRSPWGLWTSNQRAWCLSRLDHYGWGMAPSFYGTMWLILFPLLATFMALYQEVFEPVNAGIYGATIIVGFVAVGMGKIVRVLFWDYRDARAAFWVQLLLVLPLYCALLVLVLLSKSPTDIWIKWSLFSVIIVFLLDGLFQLSVFWVWRRESKPNRYAQRRRTDIRGPISHKFSI